MKLLFDQNISPRIAKLLEKEFQEATQVRLIGLEDAADSEIFDFARRNQYSIVTFDSDFVDLSLVKGFPPKIIWLRTGNLTTKSIAALLLTNKQFVLSFIASNQNEQGILEILSTGF